MHISRKKKKKHDKILILAKSKLNSIEAVISQALIDMNISHEEFVTILKGNLRSENEEYVSNDTSCKATYEIMRLSSVKSKI